MRDFVLSAVWLVAVLGIIAVGAHFYGGQAGRSIRDAIFLALPMGLFASVLVLAARNLEDDIETAMRSDNEDN